MRTNLKPKRWFPLAACLLVGLAVLCAPAAHAGDSIYGTIVAVKHGGLVTLDYGEGIYDIRLGGIEIPNNRSIRAEATQLTSKMLLGQPARMRFDGRTAEGEMVGRLSTDSPKYGIKDLGVELVRAGLAVPQEGYRGYKYGQLDDALVEARSSKVGMWSLAQ